MAFRHRHHDEQIEHDEHAHEEHVHGEHRSDLPTRDEVNARDQYGGMNIGAGFYGWLVATALVVLLASILGALAAAAGQSMNLSMSDAQREAGAIGIGAAVALGVVLAIAYYAGGYVAGRMSRFDGGRQGFLVWLIGLVVTIVAVGLGMLFGTEYNILDRVQMPRLPIPGDELTWAGLITALVILVVTLLAAMAGGKVGHRYHDKVDAAGRRAL